MIWHDVKVAAVAAWTAAWGVLAAAGDLIEQIPAYALGGLGFAALVWRLLRDNSADSFLRDGYERLIAAERERARLAEERYRALEEQLRQVLRNQEDNP